MEEEAFRIALDHVNNDTVNYPEFKLRGLIRFSNPTDDFDNIEQGEESCIWNWSQKFNSGLFTLWLNGKVELLRFFFMFAVYEA